MMNIRVDDRYAYVEIEVFGQYQPERAAEIVAAMRRLVASHGYFSELEIHHGSPGKMMKTLLKVAEQGGDVTFMEKMRRYALVSDSPGFIIRMTTAFLNANTNSAVKMKIFPMHERDQARRWIEAAAAEALPPAS